MLCLRHPVRYLLAAAAFGCLSTTLIPAETALFADSSDDPTSDSTDGHRGSGRVDSQELPSENWLTDHSKMPHIQDQEFRSENEIVYRGTGRYRQDKELHTSHRGSGRLEDDINELSEIGYRGSGRSPLDKIATSEIA